MEVLVSLNKQVKEKIEKHMRSADFDAIDKLCDMTISALDAVYTSSLKEVIVNYIDDDLKDILIFNKEALKTVNKLDILRDRNVVYSSSTSKMLFKSDIPDIETLMEEYLDIPEKIKEIMSFYLSQEKYYEPLVVYDHFKKRKKQN